MIRVVLAFGCADWQSLYVDGNCVIQNHEVSVEDAMIAVAAIKGPWKFIRVEVDDDALEERDGPTGCWPEKESDLILC